MKRLQIAGIKCLNLDLPDSRIALRTVHPDNQHQGNLLILLIKVQTIQLLTYKNDRMKPSRNVIKKIQPETSEWPSQSYRFKGTHRRWNADRFFNEYIINRYHEDDRDDDDRYRGKFWCDDDVEIID